ncbi:MAG TPA: DUF411 domain-containing protein [Caulobacteraceae bacterium]|nr:DUF411 domain-containing protein [Caulobacteraceae bacterium]
MMRADRRTVLFAAAAALAVGPVVAAEPRRITVHKTPWCGCCTGWVKHLEASRFAVEVVELKDLASVRAKYGVPDALASCHTGVAEGYVFEGHIPAADVLRVLEEKPKALGLAVPGMPLGAPGMDPPGAPKEAYETLLLLKDGGTRVWARHG